MSYGLYLTTATDSTTTATQGRVSAADIAAPEEICNRQVRTHMSGWLH
jgi:hypothetical protein